MNIVISRDESLSIEGVTTVTSVEKALEAAGNVEEVMIIGGGAIYASCLAMANKLYVTHIDAVVEGDTQFPDWVMSSKRHILKPTKRMRKTLTTCVLRF